MTVGRLDQREHFEGRGQAVPFGGIPGREPDFQIRDPGPGDRPHMQPPGQCLPDGRRPESGENARVGQVGQRHASERSAIGTRLSASSAWFTSASRSVVASCKARPTVSLMVVVAKWSRAAASTSSSISTSLFVTRKVYTKSKSIYTGRPTPTTSPRKRPADDVSAETPRRRRLRGNAPPTTSPRKRPADDVSAETPRRRRLRGTAPPPTSPRKRPADDVSAETPRRRRIRGNAPPTTSPRKRRRPMRPVGLWRLGTYAGPMPPSPLTLMAVHAHPDDEASGTGGV